MQLVPRQAAGKIRTTVTDADGAATAPTTPTVTIVRDSDGTEIVSAAAATDENGGVISYTLDPSDLPTVDLLTATWQGTVGGNAFTITTEVGVVGAFLCSLEEIDAAVKDLRPSSILTTLDLREAREVAEGFLEDRCNVALRPRYARDVHELGGGSLKALLLRKPLPRKILSATIDGEDVTSEVKLLPGGIVYRKSRWTKNVEIQITYEHGHSTPPVDSARATSRLARHILQADVRNYDERATRIETDEAAYGFLITAGERGAPTSLPLVNEYIVANRYPTVG